MGGEGGAGRVGASGLVADNSPAQRRGDAEFFGIGSNGNSRPNNLVRRMELKR